MVSCAKAESSARESSPSSRYLANISRKTKAISSLTAKRNAPKLYYAFVTTPANSMKLKLAKILCCTLFHFSYPFFS